MNTFNKILIITFPSSFFSSCLCLKKIKWYNIGLPKHAYLPVVNLLLWFNLNGTKPLNIVNTSKCKEISLNFE